MMENTYKCLGTWYAVLCYTSIKGLRTRFEPILVIDYLVQAHIDDSYA